MELPFSTMVNTAGNTRHANSQGRSNYLCGLLIPLLHWFVTG